MRTILVVAVLAVSGCGPTQNARHFRVVYQAAMSNLPTECRSAIGPGSTPVEQFTASFCGYPQGTTSGTASEGLFSEETWTLFEAGGKAYLTRSSTISSSGAPARLAFEGQRVGNKYSFVATNRRWSTSCIGDASGGPVPRECGGACVNPYNDPANCGNCGIACGAGQLCISGNCQFVSVNCTMTSSCGGVTVNLATDSNNCGFCGRQCGPNMACSPQPYGGPATCVPPSYSLCTTPVALGPPMKLTEEASTGIEFELANAALSGTMTFFRAYGCESSRCLADFAARCPNCMQASPIVGTEATDVQQLEAW